ncbi:MAG: hypothetical protein LBC94_09595 [Desulfovibrio sp.]|jgi:hypothetical protein|nr:hypothetical protein [Desulfovibrio sp.]
MFNSNLKRFFIITILFNILSVGFQKTQAYGSQIAGTMPIAKSVLELYKNEDKNISLGAMLLSVDIFDYQELEKYLRNNVNENDEKWIKCIKLYTISKYTFDEYDSKLFIESFPDDKENFWKLINFECTVTRCPGSNIISHLINYVKTKNAPDIQYSASYKLNKVLENADGWVGDFVESQLHSYGGNIDGR